MGGDPEPGDGESTGETPATETEADGLRKLSHASAPAPKPAHAPSPQGTKSRSQKRKEWRQVERARRYAARKSVRFPIFTRSVLLWTFLFALVGLAFGASGAFWWANFNTQVAQLRDDTKDFEQREQGAAAAIDAQRNQALTQINEALAPLSDTLSDAKTVKLAQSFSPSVWAVSTYDDAGKPSAGSAFALIANDNEALMVTSYSVVRAATLTPAPDITVSKVTKDATENVKAELWAIDEARDLALLSVKRGGIPVLEWAGDDVQAKAQGMRMYAVGGWGGNGAAVSPGMVLDTNADGFQHTARVGNAYRGGPIITPDGKVMGIASVNYAPSNFDPGEVHFSVPINAVCTKVLSCGGGTKTKNAKDVPAPAAPPASPPGGRPN